MRVIYVGILIQRTVRIAILCPRSASLQLANLRGEGTCRWHSNTGASVVCCPPGHSDMRRAITAGGTNMRTTSKRCKRSGLPFGFPREKPRSRLPVTQYSCLLDETVHR